MSSTNFVLYPTAENLKLYVLLLSKVARYLPSISAIIVVLVSTINMLTADIFEPEIASVTLPSIFPFCANPKTVSSKVTIRK